jgi:uncharacterized protein YmfQ (DUF2313 family)
LLGDVETDVLRTLLPPLNIDKVDTRRRANLKADRAVLAREAKTWRPTRNPRPTSPGAA